MKLRLSRQFSDELAEIVDFIALDNVQRAIKFYDALIAQIEKIPDNPYQCRQRASTNNPHIRELIFKHYVIVFEIKTDHINLLGIFNQNQWHQK